MTSRPRRTTGPDTPGSALATLGRVCLMCWLLTQAWVAGRVQEARTSPDRGAALVWAALAVGGLMLVGLVLAGLRDKSETIVNNICTNADPTTC